MMNSFFTSVAYDFFYHADGSPWFCSYSTTIGRGTTILHSELVQLDDPSDFERLLQNAEKEGFTRDHEYHNPIDNTTGHTYRKIFWDE